MVTDKLAQTLMPARRQFLKRSATGLFIAGSSLYHPGALAQLLHETRSLTEGPFYPDRMPLDTDNDLIILNDSLTPAVGQITHLDGRVLTASGQALGGVFVEIWQVDNNASYLHSRGKTDNSDANFQGYGRFLTDAQGRFYFRTIKPVPYTLQGMFRAPHIHVAVSRGGQRILTTQIHIQGHEDNARDMILRRIRNEKDRATVIADFRPIPDSLTGELAVNFDCVIGKTLDEVPGENGQSVLAKPSNRRRRT